MEENSVESMPESQSSREALKAGPLSVSHLEWAKGEGALPTSRLACCTVCQPVRRLPGQGLPAPRLAPLETLPPLNPRLCPEPPTSYSRPAEVLLGLEGTKSQGGGERREKSK